MLRSQTHGVPTTLIRNQTFTVLDGATVGFTIQGVAGQTADILRVLNSAGTTMLGVTAAGNVTIAGSITAVIDETLTGNATLSGNLSVTGTSTLTGAVTVSNGITVTNGITSDTATISGLTTTNSLSVVGSATVGTNLVVGATTTTQALTVTGLATFLGGITLDEMITWTAGEAVTATAYQIGRDADATNQLHFNIPTGAAMEFSVNDVRRMTLDANGRLGVGIAASDTQIHVAGAHVGNRGLIYIDSSDHGYIGLNGAAASQEGFFFMKAGTSEWLLGIPEAVNGDRVQFAEGSDLNTNVRFAVAAGGNIGFGIAAPTAFAHFVGVAQTSGAPTSLLFTGAAHTGITAATESIGANFNFSATKTWAAGAGPLATQREVLFQAPTYVGNAGGALTITQAATVAITGAPTQGANMTLTATDALWVQAGRIRFDDALHWNTGVAIVAGDYSVSRDADPTNQMHVNVPTGATMEFSVNDVAVWTSGASVFTTTANTDVNMSAGGRLYGGGVQINSQTLAANTNLTLDENDGHVVITTGAVSVNTITLPAASGNEGMIVSFYITTDGGQNANIVRAGADVIQNGSADLSNTQVALDDAGDYLMLECISSTMWQVVVNSGGTVT
ncbi:MAG: hypothetical protein QME66_05470 [Candidatus Eisenbacteria bacterium]|nr:hypothetical protein [Candidatus Eisenbacteria bacterium]